MSEEDLRHATEKTDPKTFVVVIPNEGLVYKNFFIQDYTKDKGSGTLMAMLYKESTKTWEALSMGTLLLKVSQILRLQITNLQSVSYQKKDWRGPACQSFFEYDNSTGLKVCFPVARLTL